QEFSTADDIRRQDLMDQVRGEQQRRTRQRVPANAVAASTGRSDEASEDREATLPPDGDIATAPRKRRRRRKPRSGGDSGSAAAPE
ncbi:MAG: polynucleotide adenylyltransferase PcnB, partial [Gammaproteobacteria bacterium]|nr:polynucleotide adenylyltransferase PcnB [Gammaproteobacteria bacterium]